MPYEMVLQGAKNLSFDEQLNLISYLANLVKEKTQNLVEQNLSKFNSMCSDAQKWAKDVGLTKNDIFEAIKQNRAEK